MRILLVALNAKYVHTNLALRYLRRVVNSLYAEVLLREFSINDHLEQIAEELYQAKPDVIGFSCYIWNLKETAALIRRLRPVCPKVKFVVGGPEVSFEAEEFLLEHPEVDALILGEGEKPFLELLTLWEGGGDLSSVTGIAWRKKGKVVLNPARRDFLDMNDLPDPYTEKEDFTGRLVYVETTRGCPFNCQFCLSSTFLGVRFLDPERFRPIFRRLLENGARTVKFVDRTFNANKRHAMEILDVVREESAGFQDGQQVRVHCEMAGDLLDDEWMTYLKAYPPGLIQMELGVQSTHQPTLKLVSRSQYFAAWKKYIIEMQALGIPLHLDLIAGLPAENWLNLRQSFNEVYAVRPDRLQLGFLKVLKGSGLRARSGQYGLIYMPDPPYTILETEWLSHGEILQLHHVEKLLDIYYNSGKFGHSLPEVEKLFPTPFDFYHEFAKYLEQCGWSGRLGQGQALFDKLWAFVESLLDIKTVKTAVEGSNLVVVTRREKIRDAVRFDYYLWERPRTVPDYLQPEAAGESEENLESWKKRQEEIRFHAYWGDVIPEFKQADRRQWRRNTAVIYFPGDILQPKEPSAPCWYLFHYRQGKGKAYRFEDEWGTV